MRHCIRKLEEKSKSVQFVEPSLILECDGVEITIEILIKIKDKYTYFSSIFVKSRRSRRPKTRNIHIPNYNPDRFGVVEYYVTNGQPPGEF